MIVTDVQLEKKEREQVNQPKLMDVKTVQLVNMPMKLALQIARIVL